MSVMGFSKATFFVVFTALFCAITTQAWFFNDFAEDRSDLPALLNSRTGVLESFANDNAGVEQDEEGIDAHHILSSLFSDGVQAPNIFALLRRGVRVPWWKGENVCVSREVKNDTNSITNNNQTAAISANPFLLFGSAAFETCRSSVNKYVCTTSVHSRSNTMTTEVTYKCCPSTRRNLEQDICEKVDTKSIIETAKSLQANKFADTLEKSVKRSVLETPNITIFAPSDKAIIAFWKYIDQKHEDTKFEPVIRESDGAIVDNSFDNEIPTSDKTVKNAAVSEKILSGEKALGHIVSGVYDVHDLDNEEILKTIDGLPIRINVYLGEKRPVVMANCALVKSANHPVINDALLHVTDAIVPIAKKSIKEIIEESPEFSSFKQLLAESDLLEKLGEPGNYTVFIPTNNAIEEAKKQHKLIEEKDACIKSILKSHIIGRTLCSGAIGSMKVMTRSMFGNWITVERENASSILIAQSSRTIVNDIVGNNGVAHVISDMIIPSSAQPVTQLLTERNHTTWLELIEKAGLKDELEETANRTLFVPSEEALKNTDFTAYSTEQLQDIIRFHTSSQSICSCQMSDNSLIPSMLPDKNLRINTYESGSVFIGLDPTVTVQCALVTRKDGKACNFMVHEVDRVLLPANRSILDTIQSDGYYTILNKIMEGTTIKDELLNGTFGPITLLAPTDEAFSNLTKEEMKKLEEDKTAADQLLRRHILTDVVCCNGVGATSWPFSEEVITVSGTSLNVRRKNIDQVVFGGATTTVCDTMATDGLIHSVDKVMMPRPISIKGNVKYIGPNGSEIVLLGI